MNRRIGILTGGGDVAPLNSLINSAKNAADNLDIELFGFIKGWDGVINNRLIKLSTFRFNSAIGGTILKSSRIDIKKIKNGKTKILNVLNANNISGLIVVGGDDTLSNSFYLQSIPQILISKTIDNDVGQIGFKNDKSELKNILNYFTLGYPTAASKIASFVSLKEGLRTTAYSHERIVVVESMGMHAGWLALSSSMGHPDIIIIPEFPLDREQLLEKVIEIYQKKRHAIIVVAEGAKWKDGSYIFSQKDEIENFNHPRFGGSSTVLQQFLKEKLSKYFKTRDINTVNPSYLYRSGTPSTLDRTWARLLGKTAVEILAKKKFESIFLSIQKKNSGFTIREFPLSNLDSFDEIHRLVDDRFYKSENFQITPLGREYLKAIIKEAPRYKQYGLVS